MPKDAMVPEIFFTKVFIMIFIAMRFFPFLCVLTLTSLALADDPLPTWNDGEAKQAVIAFVEKVTSEGTADYVPPAEADCDF